MLTACTNVTVSHLVNVMEYEWRVLLQMGLSKRYHHNELERKRRDHIKDSFSLLRDVVPSIAGEKVGVNLVVNLMFMLFFI